MLVDQMMYIQEMDSKVSFKFNKISKSRLEKNFAVGTGKLSGQAYFARTQPLFG